MRNLLNNPWVVGALCMVALIAVYVRLFDSKPDPEPPVKTVQAQPILSPSPPPPQAPLLPTEAASSADLPQDLPIEVGWPKELKRDPFQPLRTARLMGEQEWEQDLAQNHDEGGSAEEQAMRLHAVFLDGPTRIAMINRQLVKEGDRVDGYVVERIQRERVRLKSEEDVRVLEFGVSAKAPPSSS